MDADIGAFGLGVVVGSAYVLFSIRQASRKTRAELSETVAALAAAPPCSECGHDPHETGRCSGWVPVPGGGRQKNCLCRAPTDIDALIDAAQAAYLEDPEDERMSVLWNKGWAAAMREIRLARERLR